MKNKKKKGKKGKNKINIEDYIRAVKKVDREIQLENSVGWTAITRIHKSKKIYNRKNMKNNLPDE